MEWLWCGLTTRILSLKLTVNTRNVFTIKQHTMAFFFFLSSLFCGSQEMEFSKALWESLHLIFAWWEWGDWTTRSASHFLICFHAGPSRCRDTVGYLDVSQFFLHSDAHRLMVLWWKLKKKKKTGQNGATGNEIQPLTTSLLVRHKRYFPDFSSPVSATTNKTWLNYLIQNKPFICRYSDTTLLRSIPKASSQIHLKRIIQVNWCTLAG